MNFVSQIPPWLAISNPDAIHLWLIDEQEVSRANVIQHYPSLLSSDEKDRMATFRSASRQRQFLIARAALRTVLSLYMPGHAPETHKFSVNPHGKPTLSENPHKLVFNLSHSRNKVLIGVTRQRQLGVDIEYMEPKRNITKIAGHYFNQAEWNDDLLRQEANGNVNAAFRFYKLWTLKEAFIKAEGRGWTIPTDGFYFTADNASQPELVITTPNFQTTSTWRFTHQFLTDGYSMALAYEHKDRQPSVPSETIRYVPLCGICQ